MTKPETLCVCGRQYREHDLTRCDKRCIESDCVGFRRCAYQPGEILEHPHGHGAKPGKGEAAAIDVKVARRIPARRKSAEWRYGR